MLLHMVDSPAGIDAALNFLTGRHRVCLPD
jgi:hypothetical protein